MTSSQPVITQNAINFTPDNKRVYAYSGMLAGSTSAETTYLEFNTNSEYIRCIIQQGSTNETTRKTVYIYFNDIQILRNDVDNGYPFPNTYKILIPPFTKVSITLKLGGDDGMSSWINLTGKAYGMTETEYQ
tara:strand:- start:100 stop:495 length:396 start_codon:yes stop_codon:yes gene_type:complete